METTIGVQVVAGSDKLHLLGFIEEEQEFCFAKDAMYGWPQSVFNFVHFLEWSSKAYVVL